MTRGVWFGGSAACCGLMAVTLTFAPWTLAQTARAQTAPDTFPGQVDRSPVPTSRVAAPTASVDTAIPEPKTVAVAETAPTQPDGPEPRPVLRFGKIAPQSPQSAEPSDSLFETAEPPDIALPPSEAPVVNILATPPSETAKKAALETADTKKGPESSKRFKAAPKRVSRFDPASAVDMAPLAMRRTKLKGAAKLRQLDKMTGKIETFELGVGQEAQVARLRVRLDACRSPKNNGTFGTMAFLKIWDTKYPDADEAFSGWMFAESPALSSLDHPRFDLWVINCTTASAE